MGRLEGKVALITGTAGGQGRSAAILFAREGAEVVGCDVKEQELQETADMTLLLVGRTGLRSATCRQMIRCMTSSHSRFPASGPLTSCITTPAPRGLHRFGR